MASFRRLELSSLDSYREWVLITFKMMLKLIKNKSWFLKESSDLLFFFSFISLQLSNLSSDEMAARWHSSFNVFKSRLLSSYSCPGLTFSMAIPYCKKYASVEREVLQEFWVFSSFTHHLPYPSALCGFLNLSCPWEFSFTRGFFLYHLLGLTIEILESTRV